MQQIPVSKGVRTAGYMPSLLNSTSRAAWNCLSRLERSIALLLWGTIPTGPFRPNAIQLCCRRRRSLCR